MTVAIARSGGSASQHAPTWAAAAAVGLLLASVTGLTHLAGGTQTVLPHLFYVPIMLAGLRFGYRGGIAAAIAATILCGPLMPLDVAGGQEQALVSWLSRGGFFLLIGTLAGEMVRFRRCCYERELSAEFHREMQLAAAAPAVVDASVEARVRQVLDERQFYVVFQPVYSLHDGHLVSVEALARFTHPLQQPPNVWFGEAASVGCGTELELAAIELALASSTDLPAEVSLAVNGSPSTLTDAGFMSLIARHPDRRIVVEITEHAAVDDYGQLSQALSELRTLGVGLAVDDVGAGISSLRHIVRLAPDIIKMDISLVQHVRDDPIRWVLAECLVQFTHRTGCQLVAEGIEETTDLVAWRGLGASAAQGYLLGYPGPLPAPPSSSVIGEIAGHGPA